MTKRALIGQATPLIQSKYVKPTALVLEGFATQNGEPSKLLFSKDLWDIGEAVIAPSMRNKPFNIDFTQCGTPDLSLALKEFSYARIRVRAGHFFVVKPQSVHSNSRMLVRIVADLHKYEHISSLAEITQDMLDRWLARGKATGVPVEAGVYVLQCLHAYSPHITVPLPILPWRGRTNKRVTGVQHGAKNPENKTPRIPEAIAGPILQWSLRYVDDFSEEIIAAISGGRGSEALIDPDIRTKIKVEQSDKKKVERYIEHLQNTGGGLPSISPVLPSDSEFTNLLALRRERTSAGWLGGKPVKGVSTRTDQQFLVAVTRIQIGLGLISADYEITELLRLAAAKVGLDWQRRVANDPECLLALRRGALYGKVLNREIRMLMIAAYIVVGYLSGMRDSEIQSLQRGCLLPAKTADGLAHRWKVRGRVWKHRKITGDPEEWVVIEPAARAIKVLERLHKALGALPGCHLFRRNLAFKIGEQVNLPYGQGLVLDFRIFIKHVNALASRSARTPAVPDWNGHQWRLTTQQLRRTLAWHIANRPFGMIAGMIQFKHLHLQIMEGYAGHSESGFVAEVEQEKALSNLDSLVDRYEDWSRGVSLSGPGAVVLEREFTAIQEKLGGGAMVVDAARLRELLKHRARHLHPGVLNDCSFDPNYALCGGTTSPRLDACHPGQCANSIITLTHKMHWKQHGEELDSYLTHRNILPVAQVERIEHARDQVAKVLAAGTMHDKAKS